jgi:pseudouridine-5'-phosphate glycosidase
MIAAHRAGIPVFATGGIGGVHRGFAEAHDVSADLYELARTPVAVVCSGAKSILDLPRTLEVLESLGVPVIGYGTDRFPAFFSRDAGPSDAGPSNELGIDVRADTPDKAAAILQRHWQLGLGGAVVAQPIPAAAAIPAAEVETWIAGALADAATSGIAGKALTPYLLGRVAEASGGRTLAANKALAVANAGLAAALAASLAASGRSG